MVKQVRALREGVLTEMRAWFLVHPRIMCVPCMCGTELPFWGGNWILPEGPSADWLRFRKRCSSKCLAEQMLQV